MYYLSLLIDQIENTVINANNMFEGESAFQN